MLKSTTFDYNNDESNLSDVKLIFDPSVREPVLDYSRGYPALRTPYARLTTDQVNQILKQSKSKPTNINRAYSKTSNSISFNDLCILLDASICEPAIDKNNNMLRVPARDIRMMEDGQYNSQDILNFLHKVIHAAHKVV